MKTISSALLLVALSTGSCVVASDLADLISQFPECSLECIAAGAEMFDCEISDIKCQCGKMEEITAEVSPCMVDAGCGFEDITDVAGTVAKLCSDEASGNVSSAGESESDDEADEQQGEEDEGNAAARLQGASLMGVIVLTGLAAVL